MPNPDLTARIAATIRRVDGNHTMGASALAEAIAEDLADVQARAALAERLRIVAEIRAMAERARQQGAGRRTRAVIIGQVADRINTPPDPNSED